MQLIDVVHDLLKSRGNGIAAVIRVVTVKSVKVDNSVAYAGLELTVAHGYFIKVTQHCKISVNVFHSKTL